MGTSLHRGPTGEAGGEVCLRGTSRDSKRGLWKRIGSSLCMGALRGEPGGMAPLLGGTEERLWKRVIFSIGGLLGDQGGDAALPGTLRERYDFNLSEGLVYWGIREICKTKVLETATLSTVPTLGNLEEGLFTRDFDRQ